MCDLPLQLLSESSCPVDVTLNLVDVGTSKHNHYNKIMVVKFNIV